jgi:amino acid permease
MTRIFAPAIAISTGILVLLGYFFPSRTLLGVRAAIIQWAIILAGVAVFAGIFNLLAVHLKKMQGKDKGKFYSFLLVVSLLITFILGVFFGTDSKLMQGVFDAVILPVESSLLAIMAVTLIYAAIRLLRYRNDLMAILFILTVLFVMIGSASLPFLTIPFVGSTLRPWITRVLATSGARGILLGVALGTLLTGLRVLIGADRPYGGK